MGEPFEERWGEPADIQVWIRQVIAVGRDGQPPRSPPISGGTGDEIRQGPMSAIPTEPRIEEDRSGSPGTRSK
jgi:hypothetical protein